MAKDNDKDKNKNKGLTGGRGVFGTPTAANYGGKLSKGKGLTGGRGVFGTSTAANYGGKLTSNRPTSLAGGLGMQGYGNAAKGANLRTPRNATMATRNYQYGEVMGKPAAPKPTPRPAKVTNSGGGGGSFNSAFAAARSAGKSTFSYGGKSYNTKVKGETGSTVSSKSSGSGSSGTSKSSGGLSGFGKAFSSARSAGKSSFSYGGKSYNTKVK